MAFDRNLYEQDVGDEQELIFDKGFVFTDDAIDTSDTAALHMNYIKVHCCEGFFREKFMEWFLLIYKISAQIQLFLELIQSLLRRQ